MSKHRLLYWIYFLYDDKEIVYIGVTRDLSVRMIGHRKKKHTHVRVYKFKDMERALFYERKFIRRFKPRYNVLFANTFVQQDNVGFSLPTPQKERLTKLAKENGLNFSEFIRRKLLDIPLDAVIHVEPVRRIKRDGCKA